MAALNPVNENNLILITNIASDIEKAGKLPADKFTALLANAKNLHQIVENALVYSNDEENFARLERQLYPLMYRVSQTKDWTLPSTLTPIIETIKVDYQKIAKLAHPTRSQELLTPGHQITVNATDYVKSMTHITNDPVQGVIIPKRLVEDSFVDRELKKLLTDKKDLAVGSIAAKAHENAPLTQAYPSSQPWHALSIKKKRAEHKVIEDAVVPTCKLHSKGKKYDHLTNIYTQYNPANGQIAITTGVIDTPQKADEFCKALELVQTKNGLDRRQPVRLVMNQLNSFTNESDLINNEHAQSFRIERTLKNKHHRLSEVAHFNGAFNAASNVSGGIVSWFTGNPEFSSSRENNLQGWGTMIGWAMEDIKKDVNVSQLLPGLSHEAERVSQFRGTAKASQKELEEARETLKEYTEIQSKIDEMEKSQDKGMFTLEIANLKARLQHIIKTNGDEKALKNNISIKEGNYKKVLSTYADIVKDFARECNKAYQSEHLPPKHRLRLKIITMLLAKQMNMEKELGQPTLLRITEMELQLVLNILSGAVCQINCKSGLDRTGLAKALWEAINETLRENGGTTNLEAIEQLVAQLLETDQLNEEIDQHCLEVLKTNKPATTLDEAIIRTERSNATKALMERFDAAGADKSQKYKAVWSYQQKVLAALKRVGLPATVKSTAAAGLKYGYDQKFAAVAANPHATRRLPMFIETDDHQLIQLHYLEGSYNHEWSQDTGKYRRFFTPIGIELILRNSIKRGA